MDGTLCPELHIPGPANIYHLTSRVNKMISLEYLPPVLLKLQLTLELVSPASCASVSIIQTLIA